MEKTVRLLNFGAIRYYEDNDILKWEPALYILSFYEASGHELDGEKLLEIKRQAVDKLKFLGKFVDGNKSIRKRENGWIRVRCWNSTGIWNRFSIMQNYYIYIHEREKNCIKIS